MSSFKPLETAIGRKIVDVEVDGYSEEMFFHLDDGSVIVLQPNKSNSHNVFFLSIRGYHLSKFDGSFVRRYGWDESDLLSKSSIL